MKIRELLTYFTDTIFLRDLNEWRNPVVRWLVQQYRLLFYTARGLQEHGTIVRSAALTFYTLMSLVPIIAVVFAVVKGFGLADGLVENLYELFPQNPEIIDYIVGFAEKALLRTQGGVVAAVALVMLFWAVIRVFGSIENAFNNIWEVKVERSITGDYLSGRKRIEVPQTRRPGNGNFLTVKGARENNLRNIDVKFPLGEFVCVTGISGSGKSSLINEILYKTLACELNGARSRAGKCDGVEGLEFVDKVIGIDQQPIGRTPRSNPATYTGVFNDIRTVFSQTQDAKMRGYGPGRFSFNVRGGRCEACEGNGILQIEMHFLPDVYVPCEVCKGARYNRETLEVKYKEKTISDVLNMTVEEAVVFFANQPKIARKLQTLLDVGLGYVTLGQSATTLSGGEAQRVKLANELARRSTGKTVYILDEPTTGLHMADVHRLIEVLQKLVDAGNTVIVIEHNLDLIKCADHIIDLGPEGGSAGGLIVAEGTPEQVAEVPGSFTGQYLKPLLEKDAKLRAEGK